MSWAVIRHTHDPVSALVFSRSPLAAAKGKETKKVTSRFHFEVKFYDVVKQYLESK